MAGLEDDANLCRVGLKHPDVGDQRVDRRGSVVDPVDFDHPLLGSTKGNKMKLLGPIDANAEHQASFHARTRSRRRGAVLMDQSSRDDTLLGVRPPPPALRDAVFYQSSRDEHHKRSRRAAVVRTGR